MANRTRLIPATAGQWRKWYVAEHRTAKELAQRFETTPEIIKRHLLAAGLTIRGRGGRNEAHAFTHRHEKFIRDSLASGQTCVDIARELKCSPAAIQKRAALMGIILKRGNPSNAPFMHTPKAVAKATATRSERGYYSMPQKNANWRGGISRQAKYNFQFTKELKQHVRERDGNRCRLCGATRNDRPNGGLLDVHHRNFDKTDNSKNNLITLCRPCHIRIESKRQSV